MAYKEKPEQIIPRITPDNIYDLEYLLASRIYRMNLTQVPKIALVAPQEEKEIEPQLQALLTQLGGEKPEAYREDNYELLPMALNYEGYEVSRIELSEQEPIPNDIKTLIVVEPLEFNDRQKYEVNRFLHGGGSVFLAVQNYVYQYKASAGQLEIEPVEKKPNINPLISQWGFEVDERILVDQQHDVVNLSGGARLGPFELSVPVKVPIQILIPPSGMNPNVSITSRLSTLFYLWGTSLKLNEAKIKTQNLKVETLLKSSEESWTVPFQSGSLLPANLQPKTDSPRGPLPLAIMAQGQFADAYQGKTVPPWPQPDAALEAKSVEEAPPGSVTPAPGKFILIGASALFQKNLFRSGGHLNFFLNCVDAVTLGDELIGIRSKQPIDRSIGRISTAAKVGWRFFVTLGVPILVAAVGAFRVFLRRQSKQSYLKALALATE